MGILRICKPHNSFMVESCYILGCKTPIKFGSLLSHPEKIRGYITCLVGGLVNFPQYQQSFIDLYCSAHFHPLHFSCIRCSSEKNIRKLRKFYDNNNFVFLFLHFGGTFFSSFIVLMLPFSG